tara:strand:+ start:159 stop:434 length:276 start_codon:yes stop_codon:yes gene_type:complete
MINKLIKLADHLDRKGLFKEADYLDAAIDDMADPEDSDGMLASGGNLSEEDIDRILAEIGVCLKDSTAEGAELILTVTRAVTGHSDSDNQD